MFVWCGIQQPVIAVASKNSVIIGYLHKPLDHHCEQLMFTHRNIDISQFCRVFRFCCLNTRPYVAKYNDDVDNFSNV